MENFRKFAVGFTILGIPIAIIIVLAAIFGPVVIAVVMIGICVVGLGVVCWLLGEIVTDEIEQNRRYKQYGRR